MFGVLRKNILIWGGVVKIGLEMWYFNQIFFMERQNGKKNEGKKEVEMKMSFISF